MCGKYAVIVNRVSLCIFKSLYGSREELKGIEEKGDGRPSKCSIALVRHFAFLLKFVRLASQSVSYRSLLANLSLEAFASSHR